MHACAIALLRGEPVRPSLWTALWHQLDRHSLDRMDAAAVLASLSTRLPAVPTLTALLRSLQGEPVLVRSSHRHSGGTRVNIVGTGGGPATFNVSTAAALVAAAAGVPVVKTGSSAYTSKLGSVDLVRRLGIRLTGSAEETEDVLGRYGIAFAGGYVYPHQFTQLARLLFPCPLTSFGRFLNLVGPLVASVAVDVQLTGVSSAAPAGLMQAAADPVLDRRVWWCTNDLGADELLSVARNRLSSAGGEVAVPALGGFGSLEDLRPVEDPAEATEDFLAVLAGRRNRAATETVALNAAAIAVAAGTAGSAAGTAGSAAGTAGSAAGTAGSAAGTAGSAAGNADWAAAYARALEVILSGAAVDLVRRMSCEPAPWSHPAHRGSDHG